MACGVKKYLITNWLITAGLLLGCSGEAKLESLGPADSSNAASLATSPSDLQSPATSRGRVAQPLGWPSLFGPHADATVEYPGDLLPLPWQERWRVACGSGYSSPVANDRLVFVQGRVADEELLWEVDQESGEILWERRWPTDFMCEYDYSSGPASTPLLAYGRLYAIGAQGRFTAIDPASGETLWERDLRSDYDASIGPWGFGSSPIAIGSSNSDENLVLVLVGGASNNATLVAFDGDQGNERWRVGNENGSYSTPRSFQHAGHHFVSVLTEESLLLVDLETHQITSQIPFRSKIVMQVNATTPVWYRDRLVVSAYGLGSAAYRINEHRELVELWNDRRALDSQYNVLLPDGDDILGFSSRVRELRRMSLEDGSERWGWYSTVGRGNTIKVGTELVLLGEGGELTVLKVDDSECRPQGESMSAGFQDRCFTTPIFVNGLVIVRGEGGLVAYEAAR